MNETKMKFDIQPKSSHEDELYNYMFRLNNLLEAIDLREKTMKTRITRTDSSTNHNLLKNVKKNEATKVAKSYAKHMLKYIALNDQTTTTNTSQLIKEFSSGNDERALDNVKENTSHPRGECPPEFPNHIRITQIDDKPQNELWIQPEIKPLDDINHNSSDQKPIKSQSLENYLQDKNNIQEYNCHQNDNRITPKHQTIRIEQEQIMQINESRVLETTKRDFIQIQENNSKSRCIHSCYHEIHNKEKSISILEQLHFVKKLFQNIKYLEKSMKNNIKIMEQFLIQTKSYLKHILARKGKDSNWVWNNKTKLQSDLIKLNLYIKLLQTYLEKKNSLSKSSQKKINDTSTSLQRYWNYFENRYIQQGILEQQAQGDSLDREMPPQCVMHIRMQYKREVPIERQSIQPRKKMLKLESVPGEQKGKFFLKYYDCSERIKYLAKPRKSYVIATKQDYKHVLTKDKIKFLNRMAGLDENCDLSPTPSRFIFAHRKIINVPKNNQPKEFIPKHTQSLETIDSELNENNFKTFKSISNTIMKKKTISARKCFSDYWLSTKHSRPLLKNRIKPKTIMCKTNDITTNTSVKEFFHMESMTETKKDSFCVQTDSLILVDVCTQKPSKTKTPTKSENEENNQSIITKNKSVDKCINKTESRKSIATNCSSKSSKVRFSEENVCYYYQKEEEKCQSIEKKDHISTVKNIKNKNIDVNEELRGKNLKSNPHLYTSEEGFVVCKCSHIQTHNVCTTPLSSWSSLLNQYQKNRRMKSPSFLVNESMTKEDRNNIRYCLEENEESFVEYSSPESDSLSRESVTSSNYIRPRVYGVDWNYAFIR